MRPRSFLSEKGSAIIQVQVGSEIVFLTNEWTHARDGHAREELVLTKRYLAELHQESSVVSIDDEFGDLLLDVSANPLIKLLPNRSFLFKWKKKQQLRNFGKSLNSIYPTPSLPKVLMFTSQHASSSSQILPEIRNFNIHLRLISLPQKSSETETFIDVMKKHDSRIKLLAVETLSQSRWVDENLGLETFVVPPICGIAGNVVEGLQKDCVGVIWPKAQPEEEKVVRNILSELHHLNLFVRLPSNYVREDFQDINFQEIRNDLESEEFAKLCSLFGVVVLPHRGYEGRGSSLATRFMSLGIPIIARKENAFFEDIQKYELIYDLTDSSLSSNLAKVAQLKDDFRKTQANNYQALIRQSWKTFLKVAHE